MTSSLPLNRAVNNTLSSPSPAFHALGYDNATTAQAAAYAQYITFSCINYSLVWVLRTTCTVNHMLNVSALRRTVVRNMRHEIPETIRVTNSLSSPDAAHSYCEFKGHSKRSKTHDSCCFVVNRDIIFHDSQRRMMTTRGASFSLPDILFLLTVDHLR